MWAYCGVTTGIFFEKISAKEIYKARIGEPLTIIYM